MTLRTRLTAAFVAVVLVPLLVVGALLSSALPRNQAEQQQAEVRSAAGLAASVLEQVCDRARAVAEAAGRTALSAASGSPDAARTRAAVEQALRGMLDRGLADGVRVQLPDGAQVAVGAVPDTPQDCATGRSSTGGEPAVAAVLRLEQAGGPSAASATAAVSAGDALADRLQQAAGPGRLVVLVDGTRVVGASGAVPAGLVERAVDAGDGDVDDGERVASLMDAGPRRPYAVLVAQDRAEGLSLLGTGVPLLLLAVVLAAAIATVLARATTQPLEELGDAAARVAGGDLETTIEVRSRDEVGRLAGAFNTMTDELRIYVGALEASRDELQSGLSRLGDTLSSTHDLDRILTVVLETAMASTRAQAGAVWLLSPSRTDLELSVGRGLRERGIDGAARLPLGSGTTGAVVRTGEPVRASGEAASPGPGEPDVRSVIAVPLRSSGTVVGVLCLYDRLDADGFDEGDLATIRTFASQASVAVDNVLLHEEAQRLSITDGLTGLWNYRYFTMTVVKEIERAARFGRPLSLLLLDLDLFKGVNDTYGHQRGDAVLVELAGRVRAQVRDVDTVARYGGEEFVVLLPETDEEGAVQAAERIRAAVADRPFSDGAEEAVRLTISVGVAVFPVHGTTSTDLLRSADVALYAAKDAGRDAWRLAEVHDLGAPAPH